MSDLVLGIFGCTFCAVALVVCFAILCSLTETPLMTKLLAPFVGILSWLYGEAQSIKGSISRADILAVVVDALTFGSAVAYFASNLAGDVGSVIGVFAGALKAAAAIVGKWQSGPSEVAA